MMKNRLDKTFERTPSRFETSQQDRLRTLKLADEARALQRDKEYRLIDPSAEKWRYKP
ncbi:hypothetical protein [Burkholderia oklahomensis]|uniref:Uncharacterized protein n=2 Tax=Burkholderia oklahomensis TaxID=342113 RepID=A0AAI8FQU4_9BURK|nr:hypothetical protein [Burkholderia oklahomensis]AIO69335.1 hypothetical protein DM82_5557 [Burkholderia oklahomensis]AJX34990.1 hypothetical protein BG90_5054 [Burkholderia oklahomensis C6786]MBI0363075.1 hypothetical protein [Burkholderia oklahomensis]QPS40597.1 hypothetical protein I6G57_19855 [Burkholderia oklahomensis]SUY27172.1 Uncharacterised protein [Burkholderia oklahomensis]